MYRNHNVLQAVPNFGTVVVTRFLKVSENITDERDKGRHWYMSGGTQFPLPQRRVLKVDVVWLYCGLKKTQVQIESRTNSCSFHIPLLQVIQLVRSSKTYSFTTD